MGPFCKGDYCTRGGIGRHSLTRICIQNSSPPKKFTSSKAKFPIKLRLVVRGERCPEPESNRYGFYPIGV